MKKSEYKKELEQLGYTNIMIIKDPHECNICERWVSGYNKHNSKIGACWCTGLAHLKKWADYNKNL